MTEINRSRSLLWTFSLGTFTLWYALLDCVGVMARINMPSSGKVLKLTNGDLMCYVDLIARGRKHTIGADFTICRHTELLNKQVKLTYGRIRVSECASNEPCGKTRIKTAIVRMQLLRQRD